MKDLERIRLNAIIHGQRENLRELNEIRDILKKEIAHLREQLNDANKVIKKYSDGTIYLFPTWYNGSRLAEAYLEKWGVK